MKGELAEAGTTIKGAQAEYKELVTKAVSADAVVSRLQAELAQACSATSGAAGAGQANFAPDSKGAREFTAGLAGNCMAYV